MYTSNLPKKHELPENEKALLTRERERFPNGRREANAPIVGPAIAVGYQDVRGREVFMLVEAPSPAEEALGLPAGTLQKVHQSGIEPVQEKTLDTSPTPGQA